MHLNRGDIAMNYKIGVDVGGTFTDVFLLNETTGQLAVHKVSSTPEDPSRAIIEGVSEILQIQKIPPDQVTYLAHGTTVATNAIIEQKGGKVGLTDDPGVPGPLRDRPSDETQAL